MGAYYFKQPNNLYGRFSGIVDTVTDYNMNEKELYQNMVDRFGKYDYDVLNFDKFMKSYDSEKNHGFYLHHFQEVIEDMTNMNETTESVRRKLIDMGMDEKEALKYSFMPMPDDDDEEGWENYDPCLKKDEN